MIFQAQTSNSVRFALKVILLTGAIGFTGVATAAGCSSIPAATGSVSMTVNGITQTAAVPGVVTVGGNHPSGPLAGAAVVGFVSEEYSSISNSIAADRAPGGAVISASTSLTYFVEACGPEGLTAPLEVSGGGTDYGSPGTATAAKLSVSDSSGTLFTYTAPVLANEHFSNFDSTLSIPTDTPIAISVTTSATATAVNGDNTFAELDVVGLGAPGTSSTFRYRYDPGFGATPEPGTLALFVAALGGLAMTGARRKALQPRR
jgi:hypothetical protein